MPTTTNPQIIEAEYEATLALLRTIISQLQGLFALMLGRTRPAKKDPGSPDDRALDLRCEEKSLTEAESCEVEGMSMATFQKLKKLGIIVVDTIPATTMRRITPEGRREYHQKIIEYRDSKRRSSKMPVARRRRPPLGRKRRSPINISRNGRCVESGCAHDPP
jgi:hypothetical protein